jgi:arylsulfatase A-like enzyme
VRSAPHERIPTDTFKLQAAMLTELDYGVGNTTAALQRAGLWEDSVVIFTR